MRLMVRLGTLLIRRLAFAALCALAIAACGSKQKPSSTTTTTSAAPGKDGSTVAIYSSLPDSGAEAAHSHQIETGIELALSQAHDKAGNFKVDYTQHTQLCDSAMPRKRPHAPTSRGTLSTRARTDTHKCSGNWSPTAVVHNAEQAARNPQTVAYIGDLDSGATALSLPILNQAGIMQLTPGSGYPGLTDSVKPYKGLAITGDGEPSKYYPQGSHTLFRMIPSDLVQAGAALYALQKTGCQKFSVWQFGNDTDTNSLFAAVIATAPKYKMAYAPPPALTSKTNYVSYADALRPAGIRCAILVGHAMHAASMLTLELHEQLTPAPTIVGTEGFCTPLWVRGIPKAYRNTVSSALSCVTPTLPVKEYGGHTTFTRLFLRAYQHAPTTYNFYGYVAAEMVIEALRYVGGSEDTRAQVVSAMTDGFAPDNVVGTPFSFYPSGNATSVRYGIDAFKGGTPRHADTVDPPDLLSSAG
jgi:branched-chain amino acid transport system substrate-binding protein